MRIDQGTNPMVKSCKEPVRQINALGESIALRIDGQNPGLLR